MRQGKASGSLIDPWIGSHCGEDHGEDHGEDCGEDCHEDCGVRPSVSQGESASDVDLHVWLSSGLW